MAFTSFLATSSLPNDHCTDWYPSKYKGTTLGTVVGEMTNTCDEGTSVVLHFVFRDAAGRVTSGEDRSVSNVNIPPRSRPHQLPDTPRGRASPLK
jgi:hypothetical protein